MGTIPQCGIPTSWVPTAVVLTGSGLALAGTVVATVAGVIKTVGPSPAVFNSIWAPAAGGAAAAAVVAFTLFAIIDGFERDRCEQTLGFPGCVAGVVVNAIPSFSSAWDDLLPFSAMHDRVDIVAKSRFWRVIESGGAFVFCTDEPPARRSEIMRCYFYDHQVCRAAAGASEGAQWGAIGATIAGAVIGLAIGCATIIFCLVMLLVAAVAAVIIVLGSAAIGGQIAKAGVADAVPTTTTGMPLSVGLLVSITGNLLSRSHDQNANVLYWATSATPHMPSTSPQPFSHVDIDVELVGDNC